MSFSDYENEEEISECKLSDKEKIHEKMLIPLIILIIFQDNLRNILVRQELLQHTNMRLIRSKKRNLFKRRQANEKTNHYI